MAAEELGSVSEITLHSPHQKQCFCWFFPLGFNQWAQVCILLSYQEARPDPQSHPAQLEFERKPSPSRAAWTSGAGFKAFGHCRTGNQLKHQSINTSLTLENSTLCPLYPEHHGSLPLL